MKPQIIHLFFWVVAVLMIEALFVVSMLIGSDLFNNKVIEAEKLEPQQAGLLFLSNDYVGAMGRDELSESLDMQVQSAERDNPNREQKLTQPQRREVFDRLLILFGVAGVLLFALMPVAAYYRIWILQRINQSLRVRMVTNAEHLSLKYHDHARAGDSIYRIYQDSAMITSVVEQILINPIIGLGQVFFTVFVLFLFSPRLALVFIIAGIPILLFVAWFTPRLQVRSRIARRSNSDLVSRIQEVFSSLQVIKANRSETTVQHWFDDASRHAIDGAFWIRTEWIIMRTMVAVFVLALVILCEYMMAGWVINQEETFLVGVLGLVGFTIWNLGAYQSAQGRMEGEMVENGIWIVGIWGILQDMAVGLERAFYLLELEAGIKDDSSAKQFPENLKEINFSQVSFRYEDDNPVLNGLDLKLPVGSITAIVGETGSGKSTLASLLLRLYDVDHGSIRVNGLDIRSIRVDDLRSNIAIALQQNPLFSKSIAENIGYACADVDQEKIEEAAKVARADEFINQMPQGYETELGERGAKLSTGQKQRLSIARAVVRDTPVLILDEPTASLDAETEITVLENIRQWGKDRVIILITHRLSTIRRADQIAVLDDGYIVEMGEHDVLLSLADGYYRRIVSVESEGSLS